jgi:hypothetical protein
VPAGPPEEETLTVGHIGNRGDEFLRKGLPILLLILLSAAPLWSAEVSTGTAKPAPVLAPVPPMTLKDRLQRNFTAMETPEPADRIQKPEDLIDLIPFVRDLNRLIPRNFSLARHNFQIINDKIIINHEFLDVPTRNAVKTSLISLSYFGGWGPSVNAEVNVPLFYSQHPLTSASGWARYPMGNYTMTLNRGNLFNDERVYLRAVTKF